MNTRPSKNSHSDPAAEHAIISPKQFYATSEAAC